LTSTYHPGENWAQGDGDAVSGRERMSKLVTCACDDPFDIGAHAFRASVDETRHVHRDSDGMLWVLCPFCLALAQFEDRARRALSEFDGPIRGYVPFTAESAPSSPMTTTPLRYFSPATLQDDRVNRWGEDE
jgi:hypothetical protein